MIWLWLDTRLGPIRNTVCSTTWCGYRNIVGEYCEANWSSRLRKLLYEACRMNKWWVSELSIEEDHVHIIIQTKPSDSVAEVVQRLKRGNESGDKKRVSGA